MESIPLSQVFTPFFTEAEEELLVVQANEIMARTQAAHPGQPIFFQEHFSEQDRPIMNAYRDLILSKDLDDLADLLAKASPDGPTSVQKAVAVPMSTPQFLPTPVAPLPLAAPYALYTKPIHQLVQGIAKKSGGKCKYTPIEATEILLNRVIIRQFDQKFYFFDGSVFQSLPDKHIGTFVHYYLNDIVQFDGSAQLVKNVVTVLRAHPAVQVFQTTDHPDQIYFLNGALSISTGQLRAIDPRVDFFTAYVPVSYPQGQTVVCPQMDQFLNTCFGGHEAYIETAWEMLGYLLTCDTSAKCFFALVGVSNSGKSVFCRLVDHLFSPGSASYCTPDQLSGRFGAHTVRVCRINICAELAYGKIGFDFMGFLKSITGNDMRMSEQKFHDAQQLNPNCKFLFASNFNLQVAGADDAFWNRLVLLPFSFAVPSDQQDKGLLDKLLMEAPAIVAKAVEAFKRLRARNYIFPISRGNARQISNVYHYFSDAEAIAKFIDECCELAPEHSESTALLHTASLAFCDRNHFPAIMDRVQFSRKLHGVCGGKIEKAKWRVGEATVNGYRGIRLKEGWNV